MNAAIHPRTYAALLAAVLCWPSHTVAAESAPAPPPAPVFTAEITADQFLARAAFLASDELAGRESGTAGGRAAEEYVAAEFARLGLEPLDGADGFFQDVTLPVRGPDVRNTWIEVPADGKPQRLGGVADVLPFSFSAAGTVEGGVAFAGYGLSDPDRGYDDYAGIDVEGRMVIVLRHGPREMDESSPWFLGRRRRERANPQLSFAGKAQAAAAAGAAALLMVNDHNHENDALPFGVRADASPIPVLAVKRAVADALLAPSGKTLRALQSAIDEKMEPHSFLVGGPPAKVSAALLGSQARNVLAVRRGSDPKLKEDAVLVCAHLDHVGEGWSGGGGGAQGEIHNGADDNGSGSAALLEVAERLAAGPPPRRSIVFAFWCGEEKGLVGSRSYVSEPLWPLEKTVACLNMDMVGHYREGADVGGVQLGGVEDVPELREPIEALADQAGIRLTHTWEAWERSDHYSFHAKKIPSMFFSTGQHPDYHRPGDDWWKLNSDAAARIADMVATTALRLASSDVRPPYKPKPPQPVFGALLAEDEEGRGVLLSQVPPRYGAGKAGLKGGDVVIAFAGKPVRARKDIWPLISGTRPGDKVNVTVLRGEEQLTVEVEMSGR